MASQTPAIAGMKMTLYNGLYRIIKPRPADVADATSYYVYNKAGNFTGGSLTLEDMYSAAQGLQSWPRIMSISCGLDDVTDESRHAHVASTVVYVRSLLRYYMLNFAGRASFIAWRLVSHTAI